MIVQLSVFSLHMWKPNDRATYRVETQVFEENMNIPHPWNKRIKRVGKKNALLIFEMWKKQLEAEGIPFWIQ